MSSIDDRIVNMVFNNGQFQKGIAETTKSLDDLKKSVDMDGPTKATEDFGNSLSKMAVVGITALATLTASVVSFGVNWAKSFMAAGWDRLANLDMAKAKMRGLGLAADDVTNVMAQVDKAVTGTAYSLDEAATAASLFLTSGVKQGEQLQGALGSVVAMASATGNSMGEITQIYQKIAAANQVSMVEIDQFSTRGVNALDAVAKHFGITQEAAHKMVADGKVDFSTFNTIVTEQFGNMAAQVGMTLTGLQTNTKAQMKKIMAAFQEPWFNMEKGILGGSDGLGGVLGGLRQITKVIQTEFKPSADQAVITGQKLGDAISKWDFVTPTKAVMNLVMIVKEALGGNGLLMVFQSLGKVVGSFMSALTGGSGTALTGFIQKMRDFLVEGNGIYDFFNEIQYSIAQFSTKAEAAGKAVRAALGGGFEAIKPAIQGVADAIKILASQGISGIADALKSLANGFGELGKVSIDKIADGLQKFKDRLSGVGDVLKTVFAPVLALFGLIGKGFQTLWQTLQPVLAPIGNLIKDFFKALGDAFTGQGFSGVLDIINSGALVGIGAGLLKLSGAFDKIGKNGLKIDFNGIFGQLTNVLKAMQTQIKANTLLAIAAAIAILTISVVALSMIDSGKLTKSLMAIMTMIGELSAGLALLSKAFSGPGMAKLIPLSVAILALSVAIDLMALAMLAISRLSWESIAKGFTALGGMIAGLAGALKLMGNEKSIMAKAASLVVLAVAIDLLSVAVIALAQLSWEKIAKGLSAIGGMLGELALGLKLLGNQKSMAAKAASLIVLGVALNILAAAVAIFGSMSWETLAKGLSGVAVMLGELAGAIALFNKAGGLSPKTVGSLTILAVALNILALAVGSFGSMSLEELAKGLGAMAISLGILVGAIAIISQIKNLQTAAGQILIMSVAMVVLAQAMQAFASMSWEGIAKGLVSMAGALILMVAATKLMGGPESLAGAAAMLIMAAALMILTPAMMAFASLGWEDIAKSLVMLAGIFLIFGIAGLALSPVAPTLILVGLAVAAFGIGLLAAGVGVLAFVTAIQLLLMMAVEFGSQLPTILTDALGALLTAIIDNTDSIVQAVMGLIMGILAALTENIPTIVQEFLTMVTSFLDILIQNVPTIAEQGIQLILALLDAVASGVPRFIDKGVDIILAVINGIASAVPRLVAGIIDAATNMINGLADALRGKGGPLGAAFANLVESFVSFIKDMLVSFGSKILSDVKKVGSDMIDGIVSGLKSAGHAIGDYLMSLVSGAWDKIKSFLHIGSPSKLFWWAADMIVAGFTGGIKDGQPETNSRMVEMASQAVTAFTDTISGLGTDLDIPMDYNPTITPVVDLSEAQNGANAINEMFSTQPTISATGTSLSMARDASASMNGEDGSSVTAVPGSNVTFIQNNNSPEALSQAEIYRQTKNQLSVIGGGLV